MKAGPEKQGQENVPATKQGENKDNEDLAKQIPTVTPDEDNLEPVPAKDEDK